MARVVGHLTRQITVPFLLAVICISVFMFNYYSQLTQVHCTCVDWNTDKKEVAQEEVHAKRVAAVPAVRRPARRSKGKGTAIVARKVHRHRNAVTLAKAVMSTACTELFSNIVNRGIPKRFNEQNVVSDAKGVGDCPWAPNVSSTLQFQDIHQNVTGGAGQVMVTQTNSPVQSNITYDASKKTITVDKNLHGMFIKEFPERSGRYPRCAVVGNGGILANSSCGSQIDAADFVIRCNLAPVHGRFAVDVGSKTNIVTANPTIIVNKFQSLNFRRQPFVKEMAAYKDTIILVSGFSFASLTPIAMRLIFTLEDFGAQQRVAFFNPDYMRAIARFWKGQGVNEPRPSSGLMMTSVAMDLCDEVHVYGFWPFDRAIPSGAGGVAAELTHHYYDDQKPNRRHSMPHEFLELLALHSRGVLRLHVGECAAP
ncbi:alpha-2,8-sialyltransferase 8E-like isoform X2 [Petromyzon marinus]|uniref:Alpha-2,8-sialyltransferase 8E-like isoform X1 n=1 Tax=Petromyzon marinus TaxID=7757 RepID=A0AAJ7XFP3_PETMA|nr:alpha-2,8-sialyltransferase 8E-like isoform X1 [Petromyzon marinus]